MKFVISFLFCTQLLASPIHIYHESEFKNAVSFRDYIVSEYQIPEELMSIKMIRNCEEIKGEGKLDLCLKNNGDLFLVSVDRNFINESLKVFQAP